MGQDGNAPAGTEAIGDSHTQGTAYRTANGRFAAGNPGRTPRQDSVPSERIVGGQRVATAEAIAHAARQMQLENALLRSDAGFSNFLTGIGHGQDKRQHTGFRARTVSWLEAVELWRGNPLAARMIEMRPFEMLRKDFEVRISTKVMADAKDMSEGVADHWRDIGLKRKLKETLQYENGYGGGGLVLGANDGSDNLAEPLREDRIISFDYVNSMEARELIPLYYYADPRNPKYGEPAIYRLTPLTPGTPVEPGMIPLTEQIHESRVVAFRGIRVSRANVSFGGDVSPGWGDNKLTRISEQLHDYGLAWSHAASLVVDFAQPVYQMEGLDEALATEEGRTLLTQKFITMDKARSILRMMVISQGDNYQRVPTPLSGMPDLLSGFERQICMAMDAPSILVFGNQVGGLGDSSSGMIQLWYDRVMSERDDSLSEPCRRIAKLSMRMLGAMPTRFSVFFPPLYQMTEKEIAEVGKIIADTDAVNIEQGIYTADEARTSHYMGDDYSPRIHIEQNDGDASDDPSDEDLEAYTNEQGATMRDPALAKSTSALLGPQVLAMIEIVTSVNGGQISRDSGLALLCAGFSLSPEDAAKVLGPEGFEVTPTPAAPSPFGGTPADLNSPEKPKAPTPEEKPAAPAPPTKAAEKEAVPKADA